MLVLLVFVLFVRVLVVEVVDEPSSARVQLHGNGLHADDARLSG
jgi:hypothetical protein